MFVNREEYEALTNQVERLRTELRIAQNAGAIATDVEQVLTDFNESGQSEEAAKAAAIAEVSANHRDKIVRDQKAALLAERGEEFAAAYRSEEGPKIRTSLDAQFKTDGTYDGVREQVKGKVHDEVRAQVIGEERARLEAELDTPEARKAYADQIRDGIVKSSDVQAHREKVRKTLEQEWRKDVEDAVLADMRAKEAGREDDFKARYEETYRGSASFRDQRQTIRNRHEREWRDKTTADVAATLQDEELNALLAEKARLAKEQLDRQNKATELLRTFETSGIDMTAIEKGSKLTVQLGTVSKARNDGYSNRLDSLDCSRTLEFISLGNGKFKVRSDSISASKSPWERDLSLHEGQVLSLGNELSENNARTLEPYLAADTYLHYDNDTTTPAVFERMPVPVANVIIDTISARTFEKRN